MAKGGMPQQGGFGGQQGGFGGGFGGQQQGFGGGFGMPQQQGFGGFGGGFGMPQQQQGFGGYGGGFGGGYQPSRQRFNQMPQQQQGFGDTFARTMPPQQQGFGGYGMPQQMQQQQGFGGGFSPEDVTSFPVTPPRQQGLGGGLGSFFGRQGFNTPQQDFGQSQLAAQNAALQSMGIPLSEGGIDAGMGAYNQASAERNMAARAAQANQPPASVQDLASLLRGGSQSATPQFMPPAMEPRLMPPEPPAPENIVQYAQMQGSPTRLNPMKMQQMEEQRLAQMPGNPYAQQIRQEDPRMQAMRMMQRMRFGGGGGGYNF